MERRGFVRAMCVVLAVPMASFAQQPAKHLRRVAMLGSASDSAYTRHIEAFRAGLRDQALLEGRDVSIEYRWADNKLERLPALAAELLSLKPDVLVAHGTPAALATKNATTAIPIVMVSIADPVAAGLVASLARPGGNVTGVSNLAAGAISKHVELLAEIVPAGSTLAIMRNAGNPGAMAPQAKEAEAAMHVRGLRPYLVDLRAYGDLEEAFSKAAKARTAGIVFLSDPLFLDHRVRIAELAVKRRMPAIFSRSEAVEAGGLLSYGPSLSAQFRQAAVYAAKILKGAKPADLPVEQPTTLELVVNRDTARALGIAIPQSILLRADRVIE